MKPKFKLWIEEDGEVVFGEGRRLLLEAIEKHGSISAAAKELSMSYRAAWGKIKASEQRLGQKLLIVSKGGAEGGGAQLTPYAKELIQNYHAFREEVVSSIENSFKKCLYKS